MCIAIVVPYGIGESGIIVFMSRLEREFMRRGIRTTILFRSTDTKWMGRPIRSFATSEGLSSWLFQNIQEYEILFWAGFYKDLEEAKRQIIDSICLREQLGKRVFFMWERTGAKETLPDPEMLRSLATTACDGIVALNCQQEKELTEQAIPNHLVHLSSPGIDTRTEFRLPSLPEKRRIRCKLDWSNQKGIALYVGRFVKRKRPDFLIKAWLQDQALMAKADLVLVGSGFGHKLSIEREVHELASLSQCIHIIPHDGESDRAPFYRAADFMVLPGVSEGEPSVLSEGMACGLPVVASDIPGHTGLVENGRTGLLFEADNVVQLSEALHRLVDDEIYGKELGQAARRMAVRRRDISVIAGNLLRIFSTGHWREMDET